MRLSQFGVAGVSIDSGVFAGELQLGLSETSHLSQLICNTQMVYAF